MTPEGGLIACAVRNDTRGNIQPAVIVWDTATGDVRLRAPFAARSLSFSPDGLLLATGGGNGRIQVWSLASGERVTDLKLDRHRINTLAFGRNPRIEHRTGHVVAPLQRWQLAAGDSGASIRVWDLGPQPPVLRSECRGSFYEVYSLAFSPDGSLLASSGRHGARLWDAALGGDPLLIYGSMDYAEGLAFSPDGSRLAVSGFVPSAGVTAIRTYTLENGRGIRGLYGLSGRIDPQQTGFSPDDRFVYALSHTWELGVWDRAAGRLVAVFDAPEGLYADNAGIAISPDGKSIAFFSHRQGKMWDLQTGEILREWKDFPAALQDCLAFRGGNELILAREETVGGALPSNLAPPERNPRICRIYDLLAADPTKPIHEFPEFNLAIRGLALAPGAKHLLLDGLAGSREKPRRSVRLYELVGKRARLASESFQTPSSYPAASHYFDPTGQVAMFGITSENQSTMLDIHGPQVLWSIPNLATIGPGAAMWCAGSAVPDASGLYRRDRVEPLFTLGDTNFPTSFGPFSHVGSHIAGCPATDSSRPTRPSILDLLEIRNRLNRLAVGW